MEKAAAARRKLSPLHSEDDFRSLADEAPVYLWALDINLQLTYANSCVLEYAGLQSVQDYTREEWLKLTHPDDRARVMKIVEHGIANQKAYSVEARLHEAKTGDYHWFLLNSKPFYTSDGKLTGFVGTGVIIDDLKAAQAELAESEKEFAQIFNQTSVGISKTDFDGRYVLVNQRYAEIVGRSMKQLMKDSIHSTTHPDDYSDIIETRKRAIATRKNTDVERRYVRPDGSVVWTSLSSTIMTDAKGKPKYMLSMAQDITAKKMAQESLNEREARLHAIVDQTTAGIMQTDLKGRFTYVNPGYCQIVGREPQELYKLNVADITHPEDIGDNIRQLKGLIKDGEAFVVRKRYVRPDGSFVWVRNNVSAIKDEKGKVVSVLAVSVNIHEQQAAAKALQASEERLRFMAESMPQKVFATNAEGDIEYLNPQWAVFTGLSIEEMMRKGWSPLVHPDDAKENKRRWRISKHTGKPFEFEHRLRRADGVYRWHITRAQPMRDEDGKIVQWFGSNTDIDDIKNAIRRKDELETTTAILEKQRLELVRLNHAKDEFISLASHQLRTPASGVKQLLSMVLEGYVGKLSKDQYSMIARANETNERQIAVINDLLRVAQVDAGKVHLRRRAIDVVALIRDVLDSQSGIFKERNQHLAFVCAKPKVIVTMDTQRIRMVLENLFDNASKYTYPGKPIRICVKQTESEVHISVEDNGVGIRQKDIPKLFHKFTRVDNPLSIKVGGTGLGLYWAHKIVELHGGRIDVRSKYKHGTTFTVVLPNTRTLAANSTKRNISVTSKLALKQPKVHL